MSIAIKIIKILLPLALLTAVGFYAYPIIKNRYFNPTPITSIENHPEPFPTTPASDATSFPGLDENPPASPGEPFPSLEDSLSRETAPTDSNIPISLNDRGTPESENLAHITTEHCNTNCDAFAIDFELLEYCQQVCGIAPIKEVSNCNGKSGIEKDYCLKDLAIGKKDSKLCEDILDANIRLTCQNRILEDLFESQPRSEEPNF